MTNNLPRFFSTPPRSILAFAGWLAALWPLFLLLGGSMADAAATLIGLLFLCHSIVHKEWKWLESAWVQAALLLWFYTLLRSIFSEDIGAALARGATWIRFPLAAAALAYGVLKEDQARIAWRNLLLVVILFMLDGLLQYITGRDILGHPLFDIGGGIYRLTGPFHGPRLGIVLVGLVFPAILPLLAGKSRIAGLLCAGAALIVIFASGERMALLLCLLGIGFAFLLWRGAWAMRAVALAVLALVLAGAMMADPARMQRQYDSTVDSIRHFNETPYGLLWQSAGAMAGEHPWFGVGPRQFREACADARYGTTDPAILPLRCNLHPHNMYMEWLAETGWTGLTLFVLMMGMIMIPLFCALPALRADALYLGLVITAMLHFWPVAATPSFFAGWLGAPAWYMTGWAWSILLNSTMLGKKPAIFS